MCAWGSCYFYCGNDQCDDAETQCGCPEDCGVCPGCCKSGACLAGIQDSKCGNNGSLCSDCLADNLSCIENQCVSHCGDGMCASPVETCGSCQIDCGPCCPNGKCDSNETCDGCPYDCGPCEPTDGFTTVQAGGFWMGSPDGKCPQGYPAESCIVEPGRGWDELLHYVQLTSSFELMHFEVTQGQWTAAFNGWNPSYLPLCGAQCPVENISWFDATAYANWRSLQINAAPCYTFDSVKCNDLANVGSEYLQCMNAAHGGIKTAKVTSSAGATPYECGGYRLPTEAEWEFAVRAGSLSAFHPGLGNDGSITEILCDDLDDNLAQIGWYAMNSATDYPNPHNCALYTDCASSCGKQKVGSKDPNAWGFHDMSGNVWEWCTDGKAVEYAEGTPEQPVVDPVGPDVSLRVIRGGSWFDYPKACSSAGREGFSQGLRYGFLGVRLARTRK